MKNVRLSLNSLLLLTAIGFVRCSPKVPIVTTTKEVIQQGNWHVQYFFDGQDETALFHDYAFNFNSGGIVSIIHGTDTLTGAWNIAKDNSQRDVLSVNVDNAPAGLTKINGDWNVQSLSLVSVGLKDSDNTQLVIRKN